MHSCIENRTLLQVSKWWDFPVQNSLKPFQNQKVRKKFHVFSVSFSQLTAVKRHQNRCMGKFFGQSYFVTALELRTNPRQNCTKKLFLNNVYGRNGQSQAMRIFEILAQAFPGTIVVKFLRNDNKLYHEEISIKTKKKYKCFSE